MKCENCNSKFNYKDRIKLLFNKKKILECSNCGAKYSQSKISVNINIYLPGIIYVVLSNIIASILNPWINNFFIRSIIMLFFQFVLILLVVYISQSFSKFKKYDYNLIKKS